MENKPLAYRMMPKKIEEFVGQEEILGKDKILYRLITADRLSSIILWGPPGTRQNIYCSCNCRDNKMQIYKNKCSNSRCCRYKNGNRRC